MFEETFGILTQIFEDSTSLFNAWWNCLNVVQYDKDDFVPYTEIVNQECEKFKLNELTSSSFKCFIFVQVLTSNKDTEMRYIILTELEIVSKLILKK